jgi:hypothetical protein
MSTQRRENRWRRISCTMRSEAAGFIPTRPVVQCAGSIASGGTAPPGFPVSFHPSDEDLSPGTPVNHPSYEDLSLGTPVRLATNSLQSGYRIVKQVLIVRREVRLGSPPFGAGLGPATGTPATHGSPPPHFPSPSGLAYLHPALPQVPAG